MNKEIFVLGLTGSIGVGKSTAAAMFEQRGIPVWSADQAVADIYSAGGGGSEALADIVPEAAPGPGGPVCKDVLKRRVDADPAVLCAIEAAIHPLVRRGRESFLAAAASAGAGLAVAEVPLLLESGSEAEFDAVAVVSAAAGLQESRALGRPGMTRARFETFRARQMPDAEKRRRADYVIRADTMESALADVCAILDDIRKTAV